MGTTREEVIGVLLPLANVEAVRKSLSKEIYRAFENNDLQRTPEFDELYQAYQDRNILDNIREQVGLRIIAYCKQEAIFRKYILAYRENLRLGYKSALLYAKFSNITLYVWKEKAWGKEIEIKDSFVAEQPRQIVHMLLVDKKIIGYDLLRETYGFSNYKLLSIASEPTPEKRYSHKIKESQIRLLHRHKKGISSVQFSPDGMYVLSGSDDNTLRIWDVETAKCISKLCGHKDKIVGAQFALDGTRVISGSEDMTIRIWNIANGQTITSLKFHNKIQDFSYHANGLLVVGFLDGSLECYKNTGDDLNYRWQLSWSTDIDSRELNAEGLRVSKVIGLSNQNRRMLEQRGALIDLKPEVNPDRISAELTSDVAKRTGSPVHQSSRENNVEQSKSFSLE